MLVGGGGQWPPASGLWFSASYFSETQAIHAVWLPTTTVWVWGLGSTYCPYPQPLSDKEQIKWNSFILQDLVESS